jgi:hypothetical protein
VCGRLHKAVELARSVPPLDVETKVGVM